MQYKDWIIALYDRFYDEYYKSDNDKNIKLGFRYYFKLFTSRENIGMTLFIVIIISLFFLFIFNVINELMYILINLILSLVVLGPEVNKCKIELDYYKIKICLLRDFLIREKLYNVETIERLVHDTKSSFFLLGDSEVEKTKAILVSLTSLFTGFGIEILKVSDGLISQFVTIVIVVLFFAMFSSMIVYLILKIIPNTKTYKLNLFHEMLKIILIYKIGEEEIEKTPRRHFSNIRRK